MSSIKLYITPKIIIKFLRKDYTCPFDFFSRSFDGSRVYSKVLTKANKIFDCDPKGIKIPVIHLPCNRERIGKKRNKCWRKLVGVLEIKGGENEKEIKKENQKDEG